MAGLRKKLGEGMPCSYFKEMQLIIPFVKTLL